MQQTTVLLLTDWLQTAARPCNWLQYDCGLPSSQMTGQNPWASVSDYLLLHSWANTAAKWHLRTNSDQSATTIVLNYNIIFTLYSIQPAWPRDSPFSRRYTESPLWQTRELARAVSHTKPVRASSNTPALHGYANRHAMFQLTLPSSAFPFCWPWLKTDQVADARFEFQEYLASSASERFHQSSRHWQIESINPSLRIK